MKQNLKLGKNQCRDFAGQNGKIYLGDSLIHAYTFRENYYFTAGDNGLDSRDFRYWGVVPEPFIVGVASRIWKSVDKSTDVWRSERFMKGINNHPPFKHIRPNIFSGKSYT